MDVSYPGSDTKCRHTQLAGYWPFLSNKVGSLSSATPTLITLNKILFSVLMVQTLDLTKSTCWVWLELLQFSNLLPLLIAVQPLPSVHAAVTLVPAGLSTHWWSYFILFHTTILHLPWTSQDQPPSLFHKFPQAHFICHTASLCLCFPSAPQWAGGSAAATSPAGISLMYYFLFYVQCSYFLCLCGYFTF